MTYLKRISIILGLSTLHFLTSMVFFSVAFTNSMRRFDTGEDFTAAESIINATSHVLWFPRILSLRTLPFSDSIDRLGASIYEQPFMGRAFVCHYFLSHSSSTNTLEKYSQTEHRN